MRHYTTRLHSLPGFTAILLALVSPSFAAIPSPEKLLPDDTLVLLTAPDFSKLKSVWQQVPQARLWNDPALKPFREDFLTKWNEQFVKPLERDLDIKMEDYTSLLNGQITFALTQNAAPGDEPSAGLVLLLDTKDKSPQLKKNLAMLRKKWIDSGKPLKTSKIRDFEFTVLPLSSNDFPKTLRRFFPKSSEVHELGDDDNPKPLEENDELIIGQLESLLIISSSNKTLEKVVTRMTGGSVPPLAEVASYQADHSAFFRESPLYGWVNLKAFLDILTRKFSEKKENADAPNPFDLKPEKILAAAGLNGLKTVSFNFQQSPDGSIFQLFLGVPESSRQGLFKILAGEPRESRPPPFVPADAVNFQRWRIDAQKGWVTLQKIISDISPQWLNGINFLLDTANTAARDKDPGFDIKKNLIANLGDDLINYEKAPLGKTTAELNSPPSLFLLGSPNAEQLAASLRSILVFAPQSGAAPEEREFLGRKIYSVALRSMMMPLGAGAGAGVPNTLSYAAGGGYVAFSSNPAMVEEYLRSPEARQKPLRETPGLNEAAQKVTGPDSSLFGYKNQVEIMRTMVDVLRKNASPNPAASSAAANLLPSGLNFPGTFQNFRQLMDFSLLPDFDSLAKYFYFTVYGGSANVDGLSFKVFLPVPPSLKK